MIYQNWKEYWEGQMDTGKMIDWIKNASYEDLLRKWRFGTSGDPFFQGEVGKYFVKVMGIRRKEIGNGEHVRISKKIGWEK